MLHSSRKVLLAVGVAMLWLAMPAAQADYGWQGQRKISYQRPNDLFYNYYAAPGPTGQPAEMYVAPLPVPEKVGHTYVTYQPLMPHEFLYHHHRSYYTHNPGAGWTRTKVRYWGGGWPQHLCWSLNHRSPQQPGSPW